MIEGQHVGPIRTTEVLYSNGVYVERDAGDYVGLHSLDKAFTANMIDPTHYICMWSETLGYFIRWTWYYPTHNECVA